MPWSEYLSDNGDQLTELSIVLNEDNRGDALYVGSGRPPANDGGYFRYGSYVDENGADRHGWAHIQRTEGAGPGYDTGRTLHMADWRNDRIRDIELTETQVGWHAFQMPNRPLLPFAVNTRADSIMVASDTGVPMLSTNGGSNWRNLYCDGNETAGWSSLGLNLLCTGSSTFLPTGELVIGAYDYGVFVGSSSANTSFLPIHEGTYAPPDWPNAVDVEVQLRNYVREYFMVDAAQSPSVIWTWASAQWHSISTGLATALNGAPFVITDIVIASEDHVYAAVGVDVAPAGAIYPQYHFHIWEGVRPATGWDWTWTDRVDVDAVAGAAVQTRQVNRMCLIPGTPLLMLATKHKGTSAGGLVPINVSTWQAGLAWLGGNYTGGSPPQDALGRLGVNVTSVVADRLGRYLYAGCGGGDNASSPGRGGVVRFPMNSGAPGSVEILAGFGDIGTSGGDVFGIHGSSGVNNFASLNPGTTQDWEFCTRVNDIEIDPNNPLVAYVAVGAGNIPFYHAKFGAWRVKGTAWDQIWGANETGSGAKTVGISPTDNSTLYVGSVGQEFFKAEIREPSFPPVVSLSAEYAVLAATGTAMVHAIGVRVNPVQGTTIQAVTADLSPWGGLANVALLDNGASPDLEAGDGIYTSDRVAANFVSAGTAAIRVFAQASDGGYAQSNVTVTVAASAPAPVIDPVATYRLRAGSTDDSHVLAVTVSTPRATTRVTANLSAVSGPADLRLRDDGAGEDVEASDGIFTSPRFGASVPAEGTFAASVTAAPMVGAAVTQSVNMIAVANSAKFTSDSEFSPTARLGDALALGLSAKPYASVYFWEDTNNDVSDKVMITTFDDNSTAPGIWGRTSQFAGSEGVFESRGLDGSTVWLAADLPAGSRGVCYADVDNDGDTDFFLCNPSQGGKLYINHLNDTSGPAEWQGKFVDQTTAFFGADTSFLAGAMTASWGDYTGDGFVDLFVATGMYVDPVDDMGDLPMQASGFNGGDLRLFKNNLGASLRKSLVWGSGSSAVCLAGCWLDLDGDGDLDLVTTRYMGGGFSVLENHGVNATHTDNVMEQVAWTPSVADIAANSITVIDYDHNAQLDLLVTEYTPTRKQAWILRNNYGSGYSKSFTATGFGAGQAWNGAVVADLNLDGQDDFVLLPKSADVVPALFMSSTYTETPEFEDPWPAIQPNSVLGPTHYVDLGYTLGLRDGMAGGGFAADLDGDHAPDLFLGRDMVGGQGQSSGEQCLYRSTGTAAATNHWLQVKLRTRGDSNGALIGTLVSVVAGGKQWHKAVDGGSFRGGQGSNDLLFGLGSETSITEVKIVFPSGETHLVPEPYVDVDTAITILEGNMDGLTYGRPSSSYELQPGFVDWVFRWKSGTIKGDLRSDEVEVWPYGQPSNSFVLEYGMPSVSHAVYKEGGVWVHELRWGGQQCFDGARWSFKVTSGAGAGGQTLTATQSANTSPVTYCLPENYGQ